jgi:hypothetical protein
VERAASAGAFDWVLTSPPYYGLRTYLPDQWIRNWFLGGPAVVDYGSDGQLSHNGRDGFVADLRAVWTNAAGVCRRDATLVVRFGGIGDRHVADPAGLIEDSLRSTGWTITDVRHAANARRGKRQAETFGPRSAPFDEVDVWATLTPRTAPSLVSQPRFADRHAYGLFMDCACAVHGADRVKL